MFTTILRDNQRRFGQLLRQLCELGGFSAGKLSRESKAYQQALIERGIMATADAVGSTMSRPAIMHVVTGAIAPTYLQVYIWLRVLRIHFESPEFAEICGALDMPVPTYPLALEADLWKLAGFLSPDEVCQASISTQGYKLLEMV